MASANNFPLLYPDNDGPVLVGEDQGIMPERLRCTKLSEDQTHSVCCKHLGLHDHQYWYCGSSNRSTEQPQTKQDYPWHGVWKRLDEPQPDNLCPYPALEQ